MGWWVTVGGWMDVWVGGCNSGPGPASEPSSPAAATEAKPESGPGTGRSRTGMRGEARSNLAQRRTMGNAEDITGRAAPKRWTELVCEAVMCEGALQSSGREARGRRHTRGETAGSVAAPDTVRDASDALSDEATVSRGAETSLCI